MTSYDITLATCLELPEPDFDEAPLLDALADADLNTRVCAWDDPDVDWSQSKLTLIRSTWNYYHRRDHFLRWADAVDAVSTLQNPPSVVRWNSHKSYLLTLPLHGVPTVSTVVVQQGQDVPLEQLCKQEEFTKIVVKPAVSAGSFETHAMNVDNLDTDTYRRLVDQGDVLIQPYMHSVDDYGERSLIFIDGQFTHCIRKHPRFAGEDERITGPHEPTNTELDVARRALGTVEDDLLYARVDLVRSADDQPLVAELELIEPSLFFAQSDDALPRLVEALRRSIDSTDT